MGISRGFRRLSIFAAAVGVSLLTIAWLTDPNPPGQIVAGLVAFGALPALLRPLLLSWVVAGFRNSN